MKVRKSSQEMLMLQRRALGYDHPRADCSIELTDGLDPDTALLIGLRNRYLALLDSGVPELLAPDDVAAECVPASSGEAAPACRVVLPEGCRRVLSARLLHWQRDARVLPATDFDTVVARQLNPYTAATADNPVAVMAPGVQPTVYMWPCAKALVLTSLVAVIDRGDDIYTFDDAALSYLIKLP